MSIANRIDELLESADPSDPAKPAVKWGETLTASVFFGPTDRNYPLLSPDIWAGALIRGEEPIGEEELISSTYSVPLDPDTSPVLINKINFESYTVYGFSPAQYGQTGVSRLDQVPGNSVHFLAISYDNITEGQLADLTMSLEPVTHLMLAGVRVRDGYFLDAYVVVLFPLASAVHCDRYGVLWDQLVKILELPADPKSRSFENIFEIGGSSDPTCLRRRSYCFNGRRIDPAKFKGSEKGCRKLPRLARQGDLATLTGACAGLRSLFSRVGFGVSDQKALLRIIQYMKSIGYTKAATISELSPRTELTPLEIGEIFNRAPSFCLSCNVLSTEYSLPCKGQCPSSRKAKAMSPIAIIYWEMLDSPVLLSQLEAYVRKEQDRELKKQLALKKPQKPRQNNESQA